MAITLHCSRSAFIQAARRTPWSLQDPVHISPGSSCAAPAHGHLCRELQRGARLAEAQCSLSRVLCLSPVPPGVSAGRMPVSNIPTPCSRGCFSYLTKKCVDPVQTSAIQSSGSCGCSQVRLQGEVWQGLECRPAAEGQSLGCWGTSTTFWKEFIFSLAFPHIYCPSCSSEVPCLLDFSLHRCIIKKLYCKRCPVHGHIRQNQSISPLWGAFIHCATISSVS